MPIVSVVMPVYNGEQFLRPAIDSILHQTFGDFEFVIVDDGSTDRSHEILSSYSDPRVRIIRLEQNSGIVVSLNRGIMESRGAYICRMDADDVSMPERIERQVHHLESHPALALLGSYAILIDETGVERGRDLHPLSGEEIRKTILARNPFTHGSVVIRKAVLDRVGLYDGAFLHNEDYDLWLRITAAYDAANLPEFLLKRRLHRASITATGETELVRYRVKTLHHAIVTYYDKPWYAFRLLRPIAGFMFRLLSGRS